MSGNAHYAEPSWQRRGEACYLTRAETQLKDPSHVLGAPVILYDPAETHRRVLDFDYWNNEDSFREMGEIAVSDWFADMVLVAGEGDFSNKKLKE